MKKILKAKKEKLNPGDLKFSLDYLSKGDVLIFPTDTVYGLGCNAFNLDAIKKIYELKGRHYSKSLPILLGDAAQLPLVVKEVLPEAKKLMAEFWPGPLTLIFKTGFMALGASRGKETIAVRVPDHGVVRQLLNEFRLPLATTSANLSGEFAVETFSQVKKIFSSDVNLMIDGGHCHVGKESSVVDVTHYPFTILREGALSRQKLSKVLNLS